MENKEDTDKLLIDYINEYGLLGLIHNLPVNRYYTLDKKVSLKEFNNITGKAFTAPNPKTEYDTFSCKNQENVYKSRAKLSSNGIIAEN